LGVFPYTFSDIFIHLSLAAMVEGNSLIPISNYFYYSVDQSTAEVGYSEGISFFYSSAGFFGVTFCYSVGVGSET
jgi:hypothetical protein